jgi:hypothetical protein
MKIIFLDIDGVMNNQVDYDFAVLKGEDITENKYDLSPRCMDLLNELIKETGAKVVITSVWRYGKTTAEMQLLFYEHGFEGEIIGLTPCLDREYTLRGNEILMWIKQNEELIGCSSSDFESYVILDDDSDMLYRQRNNFIKIDGYCGLTYNVIHKAKWLLNLYRENIITIKEREC